MFLYLYSSALATVFSAVFCCRIYCFSVFTTRFHDHERLLVNVSPGSLRILLCVQREAPPVVFARDRQARPNSFAA
jgi:hypothetical protein